MQKEKNYSHKKEVNNKIKEMVKKYLTPNYKL